MNLLQNYPKFFDKNVQRIEKLILVCICAILLFLSTTFLVNLPDSPTQELTNDSLYPKISDQSDVLLQGVVDPLNITDYSNLYKEDQEISISSEKLENITYFLDDSHEWKASKIELNVSNIQDTRDWVNKSGDEEIPIYRVYQDFNNIETNPATHNYTNDLDYDPTNPSNIHSIINQSDAIAIRLHFNRFEIELNWDYLFIYDENNERCFTDTGKRNGIFSPWIRANELKITMFSDGSIRWYGYHIDYYEYINDTTIFDENLEHWNYKSSSPYKDNYGIAQIDNKTAMYLSLYGNPEDSYDFASNYSENDYVEFYQDLKIPRGKVVGASLSFDYYSEFTMESNENFVYLEINNHRIYSIGLRDVVRAGRNQWHNTGEIDLDLWVNTTNIFSEDISRQDLNISVGIMSGASVYYSGFKDRYQQIIWFDNISLKLTTIANATQNDINLTIDTKEFNHRSWGLANKVLISNWDLNPITLTFSTDSPDLIFKLNTKIYASHKVKSKINQLNQEGISYKILNNGTVYWEFLHNLYKPDQYSDFEFIIDKPKEWKILSTLDPTLQTRKFEGGLVGSDYVKINTTEAIYPGWWKITGTSGNYLHLNNTNLMKNGINTDAIFRTGDDLSIWTQINYSNHIPKNLNLTELELKVYFPNETLWYSQILNPENNGYCSSSNITLTSDLLGGIYNFTLFWTNGTSIGGLSSDFIVKHNSTMNLLKPNDAITDLATETYFGDVIPLKIEFKDIENNRYIENGIISFNWTTGTEYFEESGPGIYEITIDTSDLPTNGLTSIRISSNCIGFTNYSLTLNLIIQYQTSLQRLSSESTIQIHDNSSIRFRYVDELSNGISNANVQISNLDNAYYKSIDQGDGNYTIHFNTTFINEIGIYQLQFNFTAFGYESQLHVFQFEIIQKDLMVVKMNFGETIEINKGDRLIMKFQFQDPVTEEYVTGANVSYYWNYGLGKLTEDSGVYELNLLLPGTVSGNQKINILVSMEGGFYKTKQIPIIITIIEPPQPNYWIWIIVPISIAAISVLGGLSIRSYIIIPRREKKRANLLEKTQNFKDLQNIQAFVVIHKYSGIPIFLKSYSILEDKQKEIFSGFIQAITSISREFTDEKIQSDKESNNGKKYGVNRLIELDFKYFYCLIADKEELRIVMILKDKASDNLKEKVGFLVDGILLNISKELEDWDGTLDEFEKLIPPIINDYFDLYYKEPFELNSPVEIAKRRNESELSSMEMRVLNVIYSIVKNKKNFYLDYLLDMVYEEDKNLVIIALESLVNRKIIIPAEDLFIQ